MDMSGMTMTTSTTMDMAGMTTTASASMSTSTMDMSSSSMSSMMPASDMAMVFFQALTTPLWSSAWVPSGTGSYAGTCIFLIFLSIMHRILIAVRSVVFPAHAATVPSTEEHHRLADKEMAAVRVKSAWSAQPFRVATDAARAALEVLIGGIGYLLMLAVMTMNIGYFLSVLGGIFVGVFIVGRFGAFDH